MSLKTCINRLMQHYNLEAKEITAALHEMLDREANPLQIAAFLVLLRAKPESVIELTAIVKTLQSKMVIVSSPYPVLDIVGTGGDGQNTINISTGSAILAASCGVKVAKHGNRSVSSMTGSADVLEALGINIHLTPEQIAKCIDEVGIGFCYSPNFHPLTQHLRALRKELNVATTLNFLGPLLNPARATHTILGVADKNLLATMADVLIALNRGHSIVTHSAGLDEISSVGPTEIIEISNKQKTHFTIYPQDFGFAPCRIEDLRGGNAQMNAALLRRTFAGEAGPIADTLILNAAFALYIYGLQPSLAEGCAHAKEYLFNGSALTLLNNWIEYSCTINSN